jgi:hypothetical protein
MPLHCIQPDVFKSLDWVVYTPIDLIICRPCRQGVPKLHIARHIKKHKIKVNMGDINAFTNTMSILDVNADTPPPLSQQIPILNIIKGIPLLLIARTEMYRVELPQTYLPNQKCLSHSYIPFGSYKIRRLSTSMHFPKTNI